MNQKLRHYLNQFSQNAVLVVGDIMLDEYHWCEVSRISPEAPVPVCRVKETTLVPGGASNVANNLHTLGCAVHLVGVIGNDSSGDKLRCVLENSLINTKGVFKDPTKPTILKSRIVAGQQHVVRVDRESSTPISRGMQTKLLHYIEKHITEWNAIIVSDYLKGTLTEPFLKKLIALAHKHHLPVVVDPKGDDYTKYKGATILTPNFKEFTEIAKKTMESEEVIHREAQKLIQRLKLESLLVTRSEKGMSLMSGDGQKHDIPTQAKQVFDITGAGDTVISVLTAAVAAKASFYEAAYLSNIAAGIVVAKIGTSTVTPSEIEQAIAMLEAHQ